MKNSKILFLFKFHFILKLFKTYWSFKNIQTIITKDREITGHKQAVCYAFDIPYSNKV